MLELLNSLNRTVAFSLLSLVGVLLFLLLVVSLRNRVIAKLGLRNIPRRPAQSALIILGLTIGTIIIVSTLAIGDTLTYSLRRQAVDAYGHIDEVLAPPILGTLTQLGINFGDGESATQESDLLAGGLTTVFALFQEGLPGISQERYEKLARDAQDDPLIDGVAPAILFPTIIRNRTTGQGEPYGFLMGVDQSYPDQFGMVEIDGTPVDPTALRPGVGNIFDLSTSLFAASSQVTQDLLTSLGGNTTGEGISATELALGAAAVGGALIAAVQDPVGQLPSPAAESPTANDVEGIENSPSVGASTLDDVARQLGIDAEFLRDQLVSLGIDEQLLSEQIAALGIDPQNLDPNLLTSQILSFVNLNTLGEDIDNVLGQAGLELRQGEVYLSRTGAERLRAQRGDLLDIFIGPIPIPYRVAGIVDQAGPPAALAPVVVMDMAEAQRLLFMEGRINSVLVSNQGDELEGMALTGQVQERLRVLSLNEVAAAQLLEQLRHPDIRTSVERAIETALAENPFEADEDQNALLGTLAETAGDVLGFGKFSEHMVALQTGLESGEMTPLLREALANRYVQFWLASLETLSSSESEMIRQSVSQLSELEVIEPLSKEAVITVAGIGGSVFSSVFWLFGFFSILSGVMLIFMIFVMLAAERRSEMGIARAIGTQRRHLVQMFVTEGTLYDLLSAAVGVVLGLAVSYAMVGYIGGLFGSVADSLNDQIQFSNILTFRFHATPISMIIAYCLGVLLTFVVVTVASYRVSRLNIVAAIRDLPEESFTRRQSWLSRALRFLMGPVLIAVGGWVIWSTVSATGNSQSLAEGIQEIVWMQLGISALIIGIAFFAGWLLRLTSMRAVNRQRLIYSMIGISLLIIWVTPWSRLIQGEGAIFEQDPAAVLLSFALSGPLIILGAILTVIFNADVLLWGVNRILGGIGALTPVLRTAIAYPLNARFRTGMAMLLFAMVITTVVIMAVVIQATQTVVTPGEERYLGFDVQVSPTLLSFFNPIQDLEAEIDRVSDFPVDQTDAIGRVTTAGLRLTQIQIENSTEGVQQSSNARFVGISRGIVEQAQQYHAFQMRAPGYESDEAIWQALATRDDVAIVTPDLVRNAPDETSFGEQFADLENDESDGPGRRDDWRFRLRRLPNVTLADESLPLLTLSVTDDRENAPPPVDVQVIGVLEKSILLFEYDILVSDRLIEQLEEENFAADSFYLSVSEGAAASTVAEAVERSFTAGGLNATLLAESFAAGQAVTRGILRLFQGFMALGLLVGIAALGVIFSRTVVERRQQVGMLRAIGYQPHMVSLSFLLEASFIALAGILIGTVTGVVLGQNIVGEFFAAIAGQTIPTPWGQITVIVLIAYGASLLTTVLPAVQASRIYPAEALRYE